MAGKKIIELNQNSTRIKEVLDAVDSALVVQDSEGNPVNSNIGKIWVTSSEDVDNGDGSVSRTSIVEMKKLSDLDDYVQLNDKATILSNQINNETTGLAAQQAQIEEMTRDIQDIWNELGTAVSKLTITPITPTSHAVLFEEKKDLVIKYKFKSLSSGNPTGPGKAVWSVNGAEVKTENRIRQNSDDNVDDYNTFDFSSYAILGSNIISASFSDNFGTTKTISWYVETVKVELVIDNFDATSINEDVVAINYRVSGLEEDTSAQVYFELDGNPIYNMSFAQGEPTKTYWLAKQPHGAHLLKIYATTKLSGADVNSNIIFLDVMFKEENNNTPIVAWPYSEKELSLEQYHRQDFQYSVYTPNDPVSEIVLESELTYTDLNDNLTKTTKQTWNVTSNWNKTDSSGRYIERVLTWSYTPTATMANKTSAIAKLSISTGTKTITKTFTVKQSDVSINPITSGLVLDFNPQGRTNQDKNYTEFTYEHPRHNTTMTVSPNFDWVNGGWKKDADGNDVFLIKNGSRMYLDYPLFFDEEGENDVKTTGKHFKLTYKATNCGSFDAQVMNCREYLGKRYEILTETYGIKDDEVELLKQDKQYYLNGYNAKDETDERLWKDNIIGGKLVTESYDIDNRDEDGVGDYITISISDSYVGATINSQKAMLSSSYIDLPLVYSEDELMSISMDMEPHGDRKSLMTAYIDADPSRVVQYPSATSFVQENKQLIEFGSNECDVYIYRFKVYNRNLNTEKKEGVLNEIFEDYLADYLKTNEIKDIFDKNNFLDGSGNIKYDALATACPDLRILLITCERFTKDKKDKVKKCTVQHILTNGRPEDNWTAKNVSVKGQGTSSNAYGTSARNIDIELLPEDETGYALSYIEKVDGSEVVRGANTYGMTAPDLENNIPGSIPVNYFNIKVNVASSENANNACLADWYNTYNPYVRDVKKDGVRDTMEFHPCVIFLQETSESDWQEFKPDGKFHFYACGDFGNSKKNHEVFGMDRDNLKECVVEISNNTHPVTRFKTPEGWDDILPTGFNTITNQLTDYADYWSGDAIEFRYPEDLFDACINKDNKFSDEEIADARVRLDILQPQVQRLWRWVQSTDTTAATNMGLIPSITFDEEDEDGNLIYYDIDSVEYRQAKFKHEYQRYFIKDSLLYQYLFTDRYLMIDNRAKNMFLHTIDGEHWDFSLDYDNDTSLGCENSGYLNLDYNLEDRDSIGGIPVYNGNDSVLWENVRTLLKAELESTYNNELCKDGWSANRLLEKMHNYQWVKPTLLQMMDMQRKYIRPYKTGHGQSTTSEPQYLERLNGRKSLQRKRFEKYREIFTGSKYRAASFESSAQDVTMRINNNPGFIEITPYCDMYPYLKWGNERDTPVGEQRIKAGQKAYIDLSRHGLGVLPNQEVHICGATMLSSLGNLAGFKIAEGIFSKCEKLKQLYIGDHTGNFISNVIINNIALPESPLLEEFDISNTTYNKTLDFTNKVMLKKVYTTGSNVTAITFAPNGFLEEANLNAVSELTVNGLTKLKSFLIDTNLLTKVSVEKTPYLTNSLDFIKNVGKNIAGTITDLNVLVPESDMNVFDRFITKNNTSKLTLKGAADYVKILESQRIKYNSLWPELTITSEFEVPQYPAVFKDWDGTVLYTEYITSSEKPTNPIETGKIPTPTRANTASTIYTFSGWSGDFNSPMLESREFIAQYSETIREYAVRWWKDRIGGEQLGETVYKKYGEEAVFIDEKNDLAPRYDSMLMSYSLFKGWNNSTGFIKEDVDAVAQWESGYASTYPQDGSQWSAAQLYTIAKQNRLKEFFAAHNPDGSLKTDENGKALPNGDRIAITMGRNFEYENIEKIKLIEEPKICKGVKEDYQEFDVQLAYDEDWTLLIDAQFINSASGTVLVSYGRGDSGYGFNLVRSSTGYYAYPYIQWGAMGASTKTTRSGLGDGREVFVLRYEKDTKTIKVFEGCGSEAEPKTWKFTSSGVGSNLKLALGGWKTTDGYARLASGIVHRCEIWKGLLGENECKELASWPRETIEFEIAGFDGYNTADGQTKMDLFAAQSLWERYNLNTNFHDSNLKTWLNTRFLKALPYDWQAILNNPLIGARRSGTEVEVKETKIWIPATIEMFKYSGYTYEEDFTIGYNRPPYSSNESENRRLTPGVATVEIYSYSADWIKKQTSDPSLDGELVNGSIWAGSTYKIYYYGFWLNWGAEYLTRTITSDRGRIVSVSSSGSYTNTSSSMTQHVVPCLSI